MRHNLIARPPPPAFLFPIYNVKDQGRRTGPLKKSYLLEERLCSGLRPVPQALLTGKFFRSTLVEWEASTETTTVSQEAFVSKPTNSSRASRFFMAPVTQRFQILARRNLRGVKPVGPGEGRYLVGDRFRVKRLLPKTGGLKPPLG
jgi:hypothetical protein